MKQRIIISNQTQKKNFKTNVVYNIDCMRYMWEDLPKNGVDLTLTDISGEELDTKTIDILAAMGATMDKALSDNLIFNLNEFLNEIYRVTRGTIIIFCGRSQLSTIFDFFLEKQHKEKGTVRQIVWQKTNPAPFNGKHIYLSGVENAIWFKKRGAVFNGEFKNTVFAYPEDNGSKYHWAEKSHGLIKELILDNSNEGDIVFDPCAGAGGNLIVAKENNRKYVGCEIINPYWRTMRKRGL